MSPMTLLLSALLAAASQASDLPPNTWVRVTDCPGDAEGREIPPGRAATWAWVPPLKGFIRYGGYTPRMSNAKGALDDVRVYNRALSADEIKSLFLGR